MLLRLTYLAVTNAFAMLRLLRLLPNRSPIRTKSPASTYIEPTDSAASFTSTSMLHDQAG